MRQQRITRRNFLGAGGAVAATAALGGAQKARAADDTVLPSAIGVLPNLAAQVQPFTNQERLARIERARDLMAANKVDAIVMSNNSRSPFYFANLEFYGGERMWALVIPARAKPFLVCPAFEEGRAHELLTNSPLDNTADLLTWQEDESPYALVGTGLRDRGVGSGVIGIDEGMAFVFCNSLRAANPQLSFVSATPITAGCRMIKEQHEIDCMKLACHATLLVYRAVAASLNPGMTTADVKRLVGLAYAQVGFTGDASISVDEFTALPHGSPTPQTLRDGSIVMLDDGCQVEGYTSDITRTFVIGKASRKMRSVFDIVHRAQAEALKTARPGVPAADVDAAARKVIVDAGYGPGFKYFTHRLGHGIGLDMHEWPYLVRNDMFGWELNPKLAPQMVFSDEPGIYIPGEFGIRLEDDMLITEGGAELMTPQCPSLEDPFGNVT